MSDINTAAVDGLKALDLDRPIREADIPALLDLHSLENIFDAVSQHRRDSVARHFNHLPTLRPLARDAIRKHIRFAPSRAEAW